jgi:hypothetical protein
MNNMYSAFDKLITEPSHPNVFATSGTADNTVVEDIGAKKAQKERTAVMIILRFSVNLL